MRADGAPSPPSEATTSTAAALHSNRSGKRAARLLRAVARAVRQRHQRCDTAPVPGPVESGTALAARRGDRRRLADRSAALARTGGLRRRPEFRPRWRGQTGQQTRLAEYVHAVTGIELDADWMFPTSRSSASTNTNGSTSDGARHRHAVPATAGRTRATDRAAGLTSSAARPRPAISWPSESSSSSPQSARR